MGLFLFAEFLLVLWKLARCYLGIKSVKYVIDQNTFNFQASDILHLLIKKHVLIGIMLIETSITTNIILSHLSKLIKTAVA